MINRIEINREILTWGIERSGMPEGELKEKYPKIESWLSGDKKPTFRQVRDLAKTIHLPFGYLFLEDKPLEKLPIPHYRTIKDEGLRREYSTNLIDTIRQMQRRQTWLRDYMVSNDYEALDFVNSFSVEDNPITVANDIKKRLGLDDNWAFSCSSYSSALRCFRDAIENARIMVVTNGVVGNNTHRKLNPKEFRGFVLVDEYAPLIFVNNADVKAAQMFTLAHELAHIWLGSSAAFDLRKLQPADNKLEIACNKIAAEFLIPTPIMKRKWAETEKVSNQYEKLARYFKLSEIVVARRVLDLDLIKLDEFYRFYDAYKRKDSLRALRKKESGGDYYNTQRMRIGGLFSLAIKNAVREGSLLYREAYQLTGLKGKTFERYFDFDKALE